MLHVREQSTQTIVVGQRVYCGLRYHDCYGHVYAIHGEQAAGSIQALGASGCVMTGGRVHFDIVFEDGSESRMLPECILRGVQWKIFDDVATPERIAEMRGHAADVQAEKRAKEKADADRRAAERAKHRADNPHLMTEEQARAKNWSGGRQAAHNIRIELKAAFPGFKFGVTSDHNSVDIRWTDGPTSDDVESIVNKYKAGSFNGMEDIYENDPDATFSDVFGDPKYVSCYRSMTPDGVREACRAAGQTYLVGIIGDDLNSRETYDHPQFRDARDIWSKTSLYTKPEKASKPAPTVETLTANVEAQERPAMEVQKHFHTKRNVDIWACVLTGRIERAEFDQLRDSCKAAGGWWSSKWGEFPGGFCFSTEEAARTWKGEGGDNGGGSDDGPSDPPTLKPQPASPAAKLRALAERQADKIENLTRPLSQNWTPKRGREYSSRMHDGGNLERGRDLLLALADAHDAGNCPAELATIRTIKDAVSLVSLRLESTGYYECHTGKEFHRSDAAAVAARSLLDSWRTQASGDAIALREHRQKIEQAETRLRFTDIPGFFPTPKPLAERMVSLADIADGHSVLEPSAGKGDLADAIRETGVVPVCCEQSPALVEVLTLKGHTVSEFADFLTMPAGPMFDRIVMNPPFENGQAVTHTFHAWHMLKPGGILVALVPSNTGESDSNRLQQRFAEWCDVDNVEAYPVEAGAFDSADAFRRTGVSVKIVRAVKPL